MKTILYDFHASIYCQFVRVALREAGVEYERRNVDITMPQQQFEPEYLELNPSGVVPTLVTDGVPQTNGIRILRFIDAHFAEGQLSPRSEADRLVMEAWVTRADDIAFDALLYDQRRPGPGLKVPQGRLARLQEIAKVATTADVERRIAEQTALIELVQNGDAIDQIYRGIRDRLGELDALLGRTSYIAGDQYSLADVVWTGTVGRLEMLQRQSLFQDLANVVAWYDRMKARPSYSEIVTVMPRLGAPPAASASRATA